MTPLRLLQDQDALSCPKGAPGARICPHPSWAEPPGARSSGCVTACRCGCDLRPGGGCPRVSPASLTPGSLAYPWRLWGFSPCGTALHFGLCFSLLVPDSFFPPVMEDGKN